MSAAVVGAAAWTSQGDLRALADALAAPESARARGTIDGLDRGAPAEVLLERVVAEALGGRSAAGAGLVVGTSSGNVCGPWERWNRARLGGTTGDEAGTGRDAPTLAVARRLGFGGPVTTVSVACASGSAALAVGLGWLRDGRCARVVCAGVDALSEFVEAGFRGLGAVGAGAPRPFQADRDGLMLGEGAGALVLEAQPEGPPLAWLLGCGLSADAFHLTTPDPEGRGAEAAVRSALRAAGLTPDDVRWVSVHGTATRANDAMEAVALRRAFGEPVPPLHAVKALVGHTMGAAGAIEAAVLVDALARGRWPRPLSTGGTDDVAASLRTSARGAPGVALAMSSAFGGINCATVFGRTPGPARVDVPVRRGATFSAPDARSLAWPDAPASFHRATDYVRAGLLAVRGLEEPLPEGAALVLASRSNCRAVDLVHHGRIVAEGPARASRRAFVGTLPAAPICEASMTYGLRGPLLAFVDGPERAHEEAERLVRHGAAPAAVAVVVEAPGEGPSAVSASSYWAGS